MTNRTIRAARPDDHHAWAALFRDYRAFYRLDPSDEVIERVWSWILDPANEVNAYVAEQDGELVGLAHWRRFARPSSGTVGIWLDDLFAAAATRGTGVGRALIEAVASVAEAEGRSVVRWITAHDNSTAQALYDRVATKTSWLTYDFAP